MNGERIAKALGWVKCGRTDVGDRYPAWYDDYRTPDGRVISSEPPYFENAVADEIKRLRLAAPGPKEATP